MRLHELADRDQQLDELNVGKAVKTVGRGIGKAVGGVAQGIGAVAGGIAGIPGAVKKGFQAGKATVAGTDTAQPQAAGSASGQQAQAGQKPAAAGGGAQSQPAAGAATQQQAGGALSAFQQGLQKPLGGNQPQQGQQPADDDSDDQQAAPEPTPAQPAAAQTQSGQAQEKPEEQPSTPEEPNVPALRDRIMKLDSASRQEILKAVTSAYLSKVPALGDKTGQKSAAGDSAAQGQPADSAEQPAASAEKPAAGAEQPAADTAAEKPAGMPAGRFGQEMGRLATPLAGADSETPGAALPQKAAGNRPQGGGKVAGQLSTNPRAVKRREQRAAKKPAGKAPSQAEIDADRERIMGPTSDSIIRKRPAIVEGFSLFRKQR
jgi:hypothetical protein